LTESRQEEALVGLKRAELSVVTIVLNEERNIERFLRSACKAIRGIKAELILVDCGSSDRTVEVASQYPVQIYQVPEGWPKGTGPAIYSGVCKASAKYIHSMDADVEIESTWFKRAIAFLDAHQDIAAVAGRWKHIGQNGGLVDQVQTDMEELVVETRRVTGGPFLFRSEILHEINFNPYLPGGVEIDLAIRLKANGYTMARIPEMMLVHHDHPTNPWQYLKKAYQRYGQGMGYAVRYALRTPQVLRTYIWALKRELLVVGWLTVIPASLLVWALLDTPLLVWLVLLAGIAAFAWPIYKCKSFREGSFRRTRDIFWSFGFVRGLLRRPQPTSSFPTDPIHMK
jgi:glycosyltransferase involved in cell wall biosynthesis